MTVRPVRRLVKRSGKSWGLRGGSLIKQRMPGCIHPEVDRTWKLGCPESCTLCIAHVPYAVHPKDKRSSNKAIRTYPPQGNMEPPVASL